MHETGAGVVDRYTTACQPGGAAMEVVPTQDDRSCEDPKALSSFCMAQYGCLSRSPVVACHCRLLEWSGCDPGRGHPKDRGNIGCIRPLGLRSLEPGELVPVQVAAAAWGTRWNGKCVQWRSGGMGHS